MKPNSTKYVKTPKLITLKVRQTDGSYLEQKVECYVPNRVNKNTTKISPAEELWDKLYACRPFHYV